jgi:hypothetical protein
MYQLSWLNVHISVQELLSMLSEKPSQKAGSSEGNQ